MIWNILLEIGVFFLHRKNSNNSNTCVITLLWTLSDHANSEGGLGILFLPRHQLFWWRQRNHSAHSPRCPLIQKGNNSNSWAVLCSKGCIWCEETIQISCPLLCRAPRPARGGNPRSEGQNYCTALDDGFWWQQSNNGLWYWEQEQVRYQTKGRPQRVVICHPARVAMLPAFTLGSALIYSSVS